MRIFAVSGSIRTNSSNHTLLHHLSSYGKDKADLEIYPELALLPVFDPAAEPAPEIVQRFRKKISEADALIICTPEYAFGIPGVLKNALDWTVSSGDLSEKPVALITASSSGEKAHQAMSWVLDALGAAPAENCRLLISFIRTKVNSTGITDEATRLAVQQVFDNLISRIASTQLS